MKQINPKLRNAVLSLVMILIICLAVIYLYTNKSLLEGLIGASPKEVMNEVKIQLTLVVIICSGVGLYTLFSVATFIKVAEYSFSALYFIGCTVVWFKIYSYGKEKEKDT